MRSGSHSRKRGAAKKEVAPKENLWSFLIVLAKGLIQLINNNKIYPAMALCLLMIFALVVWRLPDTALAENVTILVNAIVGKTGGLITLLLVSNLGWIYLLKRQRELYRSEIDRLAEIRKALIHSKDSGGGIIENHRSSTGDCKASYILPGKKDR